MKLFEKPMENSVTVYWSPKFTPAKWEKTRKSLLKSESSLPYNLQPFLEVLGGFLEFIHYLILFWFNNYCSYQQYKVHSKLETQRRLDFLLWSHYKWGWKGWDLLALKPCKTYEPKRNNSIHTYRYYVLYLLNQFHQLLCPAQLLGSFIIK